MHLGKHIGQRLNSYASLKDAWRCFDTVIERDVFLWNVFIGLHARCDESIRSFQLFQQMQQESVVPDNVTLVHLLSAHTKQGLLYGGKCLHSCILQETVESNVIIGTALLTMYGRLGRVELAKEVFSQMKARDVALWNAMMNIYTKNGHHIDALQLFNGMFSMELCPDNVTFACVLGICANLPDLDNGRLIHACIIFMEEEFDAMVASALVNMYGKCSSLDDAGNLFNKISEWNVITWNALISGYVGFGENKQALLVLCQMHQEGVLPTKVTFVSILGALHGEVALTEGKRWHAQLASCGFLSDKVVTTALLNMYASCGSKEDAEYLFEGMEERTNVSWNAMLWEHVQNKSVDKAYQVFDQMLWEGHTPDRVTFLGMLSACTHEVSLTRGVMIHIHIKYGGYESEVAVATALVTLYGKLGDFNTAKSLFDNVGDRNILLWNGLLRVYGYHGHNRETFQMFDQLKQEGMMPNESTVISTLSSCLEKFDLVRGKKLHACTFFESSESETALLNAFISMYTKCDSLTHAVALFEQMREKNIFSWNGLIGACARRGEHLRAFQLLYQMRTEGTLANDFTFVSILEACGHLHNPGTCSEIHVCIAQGDSKGNVTIASALVKAYGACGVLAQARTVFDSIAERDVILWNTMVGVYSRLGHASSALQMLSQMHEEGQLPTNISYVSLFSACATSNALCQGMRLHSSVVCSELELDGSVMNSLIFMYGKCGHFEVSEMLFSEMPMQDRVAWTGMIAIYAQHNLSMKALRLFHQMLSEEGLLPDGSTFVSALSACNCSQFLAEGKKMHACIFLLGLELELEVANGLLCMYGRCGGLEDACVLFECLPQKDTCSWNTMLALFSQHGHDLNAIDLFRQMQQEEVHSSDVTYVSILSACGNLASLANGRRVHFSIACNKFESATTAVNALISMYGRCGSIDDAQREFNEHSTRDIVSWNAMIAAHAQHGFGKEAFELLNEMRRARSQPNEVSFLTTISACSHSGLVDVGCELWSFMCEDLGVMPAKEHYACLVDVFGRAGRLIEAEHLIWMMPFQPCDASWATLLSACKDHAHVALGCRVAYLLFEIDPNEMCTHVMLSNILASRLNALGA